jgi:hypothetical protein
MDSEKAETITGRCLRADIRFEYQGEPIMSQHCHCESCRRHTGRDPVNYGRRQPANSSKAGGNLP